MTDGIRAHEHNVEEDMDDSMHALRFKGRDNDPFVQRADTSQQYRRRRKPRGQGMHRQEEARKIKAKPWKPCRVSYEKEASRCQGKIGERTNASSAKMEAEKRNRVGGRVTSGGQSPADREDGEDHILVG